MHIPRPRPNRMKRHGKRSRPSLNHAKRLPANFHWQLVRLMTTDCANVLSDADIALVDDAVRHRDWTKYQELGDVWGLQSIASRSTDYSPAIGAQVCISGLIKKYRATDGLSDEDRKRSALAILEDCESKCSSFNRKGSSFLEGSQVLKDMQHFVLRTIGYSPPEVAELSRTRHGPGADTATELGLVSAYDKYVDWPYHVTPAALPYACQLIRNDERWYGALEDAYRSRKGIPMWEILPNGWLQECFTLVKGNRITTVPKDYRKDRPIAIEPRANLMLQLGVDGFVRKRLKRWGINLDSQEKNRLLAWAGSLECDSPDAPATIDLSSASDTISLRLVKLLFPSPWFSFLCVLRSPRGQQGGRWKRYSRLSSMGNGYTFAIESLIFAAMVYAAMRAIYGKWIPSLTAVFGDDLIVPKAAAPRLLSILEAGGLAVNHAKSFMAGNVRESCGTDWVSGVNVRGVFLQEPPVTVDQLYSLYNRLRWWGHSFLGRDLERTQAFVLGYIPEAQRLLGPVSNEDWNGWLHASEPPETFNLHGKEARSWRDWTWHHPYILLRNKTKVPTDFLLGRLALSLSKQADHMTYLSCRESYIERCRPVGITNRNVRHIRGKLRAKICVRTTSRWNAHYRHHSLYGPDLIGPS